MCFMRADVFGIRAFLFWSDRSRCNQWRCVRIATANYQINEEIRDKEVRVSGADGAQLGIMSSAAALEIAIEKDLDLVKIAPGSNPPVCKIMDYGKYRFEQAKREKEARRNQHVIEVKEIRMSPGIGENDFNTKLKNGQKFLQGGDRLKVTIRFRGREMAHTNIGEQLLRDFTEISQWREKEIQSHQERQGQACPCVQEPHSHEEGHQALPSSAFHHLCGCDY